ncbi:glycosyltransferase [Desulfosediminicola sp.]|uniref:glycosyltransferase n=1 Tax=Desulfosediminicola sp. TaxID=2886825 RepID=UPI003AF2C449
MKTNNEYHVTYVGTNNFPKGLATVQRQTLIAKGLITNEVQCIVLSRFNTSTEKNRLGKGTIEGVEFITCSPLLYRHKSVLVRNLNKFAGFVIESLYIIRFKKKGVTNVLLSTRTSFIRTCYYRVLSWLLGMIYVVDINEHLSGVRGLPISVRLNHFLFEKSVLYLVDQLIVISEYLEKHYKSRTQKPIIKIPVICDVDFIKEVKTKSLSNEYVLYCSSAAYLESIQFTIDCFKQSQIKQDLVLIISGDKKNIQRIVKYIERLGLSDVVKVYSNLEYEKLIQMYKSAKALILPLPETEQHEARFPHKLGEFAASEVPVIVNDWGEVRNYFSQENAYIVPRYSVEAFAKCLRNAMEKNSVNTGARALAVATEYFDYKMIGRKVSIFFEKR